MLSSTLTFLSDNWATWPRR